MPIAYLVHIPRGLKKGIRKTLAGTPVTLDLPANGRPEAFIELI
jgi:hypothetical protein